MVADLEGESGSRLILKNVVLGKPAAREFVRNLFNRFGVPADRIDLDGPAEHFAFLERYRDVDVALDTFPYNGGTTTMEALWQGVPVLTFPGDRWAARISASLLVEAGLSEFVAPDLEGYIALAVSLAGDPGTPARLEGLATNHARASFGQKPVCDVGVVREEHGRRISEDEGSKIRGLSNPLDPAARRAERSRSSVRCQTDLCRSKVVGDRVGRTGLASRSHPDVLELDLGEVQRQRLRGAVAAAADSNR